MYVSIQGIRKGVINLLFDDGIYNYIAACCPAACVAAGAVALPVCNGSTETKRRSRRLSLENLTWPSTRENSVWSFPIPTCNPGWNSVPRWRTIMLPATQHCPPYNLMPRYLGLESLLFCVEPPCFLEAHRTCWS